MCFVVCYSCNRAKDQTYLMDKANKMRVLCEMRVGRVVGCSVNVVLRYTVCRWRDGQIMTADCCSDNDIDIDVVHQIFIHRTERTDCHHQRHHQQYTIINTSSISSWFRWAVIYHSHCAAILCISVKIHQSLVSARHRSLRDIYTRQ